MNDSQIHQRPDGRTNTPLQDSRITLLFVALGFGLSVLVILGFAVQNAAQVKARNTILAELNQLRGDYSVRLNHRDVGDGALLVASIKRMRQVPAHHSHPTTAIHVDVRDGRHSVVFLIARDSEYRDEYWVFRPGDNLQGDPRGQEAGRIFDEQLTGYLQRLGF